MDVRERFEPSFEQKKLTNSSLQIVGPRLTFLSFFPVALSRTPGDAEELCGTKKDQRPTEAKDVHL